MKQTTLLVIASALCFAACKNTPKATTETAATAPPVEVAKAVPATLTDAEKAAGYQLLFDGVSTKGWHVFLKDTASHWEIAEGVLSTKGGHNDLVSDAEFENFELIFDFNVGKGGNSGVMYGVQDDPKKHSATYMTGIEYQIIDDTGWKDELKPAQKTGAVYDLYSPKVAASKGAEQWNSAKIVSNKGRIQHFVNDQLTAEYVWNSPDYNARVAKSKFKDWPFGKTLKGHLAIQDHGQAVALRNIKIKTL